MNIFHVRFGRSISSSLLLFSFSLCPSPSLSLSVPFSPSYLFLRVLVEPDLVKDVTEGVRDDAAQFRRVRVTLHSVRLATRGTQHKTTLDAAVRTGAAVGTRSSRSKDGRTGKGMRGGEDAAAVGDRKGLREGDGREEGRRGGGEEGRRVYKHFRSELKLKLELELTILDHAKTHFIKHNLII